MGLDAEAALSSLLALWKRARQRLQSSNEANEAPASPLILPESRKPAKKINEMVYLVHEPPDKPQLEVVFFHGLELKHTGQAHVATWMSRDDSEFWLQTWLHESFPDARILTISYDSSGALDMFLTAENLLSSLTMNGGDVGKAGCPVIFVGHCLGGLIIKELCLFASDTISRNSREKLGVQRVHDLFSNLKGMFFLGTPQTGSVLGDLLHDLFEGEGAPIEEIETLKASSARRNEHFNDLKSLHKWATFGIGETRETDLKILRKCVHVSPEASTRPYMDGYYSVDADHYDICKPKGKDDSIFLHLSQFLTEMKRGGVLEAGAKADIISGREYVVDQERRAEKLEEQLAQPGIHTIFVLGLSGVGKTTLAQQVFRNLSHSYEVICFVSLDNINLTSSHGEVNEQVVKEQVVARLVTQLDEVDRGFEQNRSRMIYRLKGRKVLMVLDNVDLLVQLKALSTEEWLETSSSKLLITTNNPRVISHTSTIFEVKYLSESESKELFNHYAFNGKDGPDHLKDVIQQVIDKCENHPLSLKVLGGFVGNMGDHYNEEWWLEIIRKLQRAEEVDGGRDSRIFGKLKLCYDNLPHTEQEIFLDIATCFHAFALSWVERIWKARWGSTEVPRANLQRRFLFSNEGGYIKMHQLLRNLGQSIACPSGTSIDQWKRIPESTSRWEEIEEGQGEMETSVLCVYCWEMDSLKLQETSFLKCHRLQYLILDLCHRTTPERLELPRSLVYLSLSRGSFTACPVNFTHLRKLVVLELSYCRSMESLVADLENVKELTWLELRGCQKLRELPRGLSKKLEYLGVKDNGLEKLPEELGRLIKLTRLTVTSRQLTRVPEGVGNLGCLSELDLSSTSLTSLPESIGRLEKLKRLDLRWTLLSSLPDSICELKLMRSFEVSNTVLAALPENIGHLVNLTELGLHETCLKWLPESVGDLCKLTKLDLRHSRLESLPNSIGGLISLEELDLKNTCLKWLPESVGDLFKLRKLELRNTPLESLPNSICRLINLEELDLDNTCLKCLPESVGDLCKLRKLELRNTSLESVPNSICRLINLEELDLGNTCLKFVPESMGDLCKLRKLELHNTPLESLPNSIGGLLNLKRLVLHDTCLKCVPESVGDLCKLRKLDLHNTPLESVPKSIGRLINLEELDLENTCLKCLPESVGDLCKLTELDLHNTRLESVPNSIGRLINLEELHFENTCLKCLPESVGDLCKLRKLGLRNTALEAVPNSIGRLVHLEELDLGKTCLKCLPESVGDLCKLTKLSLHNTPLESIPNSIGRLINLEELDLEKTCLKCLPESVGDLCKLKKLDLQNTPLESVPNSIGRLINLGKLYLVNTSLKCLPESVGDLSKLTTLDLDCTPLETVPDSIGKLESLRWLSLRGTQLRTLPRTIGDLNLSTLLVSSTNWRAWPSSVALLKLELLEAPISSIWSSREAASSYEEVEGEREDGLSSNLTSEQEDGQGEENDASCSGSEQIEDQLEEDSVLQTDATYVFKIYSRAFQNVSRLRLNGRCCRQSWLQPLFRAMQQEGPSLVYLHLEDFVFAEEIPCEIGTLMGLQYLSVTGWSRLLELPASLGELDSLEYLYLENNPKLHKLPDCLSSLPVFRRLDILQCGSLHSMPRSFSRESPLHKHYSMDVCSLGKDYGWLSSVVSDSWRILQSFLMCCGKLVPLSLSYVVECNKLGKAQERALKAQDGVYELEKEVFMELFSEADGHRCRWDTEERRLDEEESSTSTSAISCGSECKQRDDPVHEMRPSMCPVQTVELWCMADCDLHEEGIEVTLFEDPFKYYQSP